MDGWTILLEENYSLPYDLHFWMSGERICSTYLSRCIGSEYSCSKVGWPYPKLCVSPGLSTNRYQCVCGHLSKTMLYVQSKSAKDHLHHYNCFAEPVTKRSSCSTVCLVEMLHNFVRFQMKQFCGCMCRVLWYGFKCAFHFIEHTLFAVGSSLTRNLIFEICSRGDILLICEGTETLENCILSSLGHFLIGFVYYVGFPNKYSLYYTLLHIHKQRAVYITIKGVCAAQYLLPYSQTTEECSCQLHTAHESWLLWNMLPLWGDAV
jgi:hypothetical protein